MAADRAPVLAASAADASVAEAPANANETPRPALAPELVARAQAIGTAWTHEYVRDLRSQERDIVGGWPGTLREARRRVIAALPRHTDAQQIDDLARIANLAARRGWESVSEPDLEP